MAGTISSLGVGTGIDTATILSKLMQLEQTPLNALKSKASAFNTKLSVYGQLKSALSTLQTAAKTLADPSKLGGLAATVGNKDILSATASFNAGAGVYSINVSQLATAQKSVSGAYASGDSFGSGTLKFTIGGEEKTVTIGDGASLNDIRAAINGANIGVTATVISSGGVDRLVLSGADTGAAGSFSLAVDSADAKLQSLAGFDSTLGIAAQDAKLTIDGVAVTSSSNTLTTALTGMTLTLSQVGQTQMTVAKDSSKAADAVNAFVKAFNDVVSLLKSNSAYDSKTQTAQPLNGETTARSVLQMLSDARNQTPDGLAGSAFQTLSAMGISITTDGLLTVDSDKLNNAISTSFSDVQKTLGAFGQVFSDKIDSMIGANGLIANRVDGLNRSIKMNQSDQEAMQRRIDAIQARYQAQFTALDTLMASMQTTGSYLTQQLTSLNNNR
ncbi:MAG: flagellar filament capping protein FliD [Desulfobulbus sp.]|nr:flagellar filament capping protein FliD [Desulfobulbus sp.]